MLAYVYANEYVCVFVCVLVCGGDGVVLCASFLAAPRRSSSQLSFKTQLTLKCVLTNNIV